MNEELQAFIREGQSRGKTMERIEQEAIAAGLLEEGQTLEAQEVTEEAPKKSAKKAK